MKENKEQDLICENIKCSYRNEKNSCCTLLNQNDALTRRETCAERILNGSKLKDYYGAVFWFRQLSGKKICK